MRCANHPDREASAFCQNCGKPLCPECVRSVGTSVLCELCYELRVSAAIPAGGVYPPPPGAGTSPGLAALLGFIPGVGAMYNGQYAKGLLHLAIFAILMSLSHESGLFGLFVAGWICYMVYDAYATARARRDGTPLPNPFGLNEVGERLGFGRGVPSPAPSSWPAAGAYSAPGSSGVPPFTPGGAGSGQPAGNYSYAYAPPGSNWGAPQEGYTPVPPVGDISGTPPPDSPYVASRRIPAGAIWLIGLGLVFLLGNMGLFWIRARFVGPLLLIALAVWVFLRSFTEQGHVPGIPYSARVSRALGSSMWLAGTGLLWLLDVLDVVPWSRSWPLFLILGGIAIILRRSIGTPAYPAPYAYSPQAPAPASASAPASAIVATPPEPGPREER